MQSTAGLPGARQVRTGRVGEGTEFGEIASAAKGLAVAGQHHFAHRFVEAGHLEGLQQGGARIGGERIVSRAPVEPDAQGVAVPFGPYRVWQHRQPRGPAFAEPAGELGSGLQRRVRQRFGDDTREHRCRGRGRTQYVVADRRGVRPACAPFGEFGDCLVDRGHRDGAAVRTGRLGQRERRVVLRITDRDADAAGQVQHVTNTC